MNILLIVLITLFGRCVSLNIIGNCIYEDQGIVYLCRFSAEPIKHENDVVAINGVHVPGFNDDSVTSIIVDIDSVMVATPVIFCEKFKNVRNIILSRVQLHKVTENSFSRCLNVEFIYLNINQVDEIATNALRNNGKELELSDIFYRFNLILSFQNLAQLNRLEIDRNSLYHINPALFRGLTNLKQLNLRGNFITEIPLNAFSDFVNVEQITLFSNRITRIHPDFLDTIPARQTVILNLFDNICISQYIVFTRDTIEQIRPLFSECFNNYRQYYGLF